MSELITNLLPDPRPFTAVKWMPTSGVSVHRYDVDRLFLETDSDGNDRFVYTLITLPAGTYRFGAKVSAPQVSYARNILRFIRHNPTQEMGNATWSGRTGRYVTAANTLATQTLVELRMMIGPKAGSQIWFSHLFLMTDEDYARMLKGDVDWFCGAGYDLLGGGASS